MKPACVAPDGSAGAWQSPPHPPVVIPASVVKLQAAPTGRNWKFGQAPTLGVLKDGSAMTGWAVAECSNTARQSRMKNVSFLDMLLASSLENANPAGGIAKNEGRSEEHTSELQSLRHLVCRLL